MWRKFPFVFQMKPFPLIVLKRGDSSQVSSVCKSNKGCVPAERPQAPDLWGQKTNRGHRGSQGGCWVLAGMWITALRKVAAPGPRQKWKRDGYLHAHKFVLIGNWLAMRSSSISGILLKLVHVTANTGSFGEGTFREYFLHSVGQHVQNTSQISTIPGPGKAHNN